MRRNHSPRAIAARRHVEATQILGIIGMIVLLLAAWASLVP